MSERRNDASVTLNARNSMGRSHLRNTLCWQMVVTSIIDTNDSGVGATNVSPVVMSHILIERPLSLIMKDAVSRFTLCPLRGNECSELFSN